MTIKPRLAIPPDRPLRATAFTEKSSAPTKDWRDRQHKARQAGPQLTKAETRQQLFEQLELYARTSWRLVDLGSWRPDSHDRSPDMEYDDVRRSEENGVPGVCRRPGRACLSQCRLRARHGAFDGPWWPLDRSSRHRQDKPDRHQSAEAVMTRPRSLFAGGPNAVSEKDRPKCIREMDGDFRAAMMKAARTGLERPPATSISTVACTKRPLFVARPSPQVKSENCWIFWFGLRPLMACG